MKTLEKSSRSLYHEFEFFETPLLSRDFVNTIYWRYIREVIFDRERMGNAIAIQKRHYCDREIKEFYSRLFRKKFENIEEILDLCKGRVGIYLDLKDASVDKLVYVVKKWDMTGQVLWYADFDELERVAEMCPECILMPDPGPEENLPKVIERFQPSVIAAVWCYYSWSFAAKCHQAGAIVIVDESAPTCWEDALEWESDGIQTDHPAQLIAFLKLQKR